MRKQQSGFTLIELIAVLVILGILAATAVPRFIDLSDEAATAAINNIAGSIESASSLNYAVYIANQSGLSTDTFQTVDACDGTSVNNLLTNSLDFTGSPPDIPPAFTVTGTAPADNGASATCTITTAAGASADFAIIGTGITP